MKKYLKLRKRTFKNIDLQVCLVPDGQANMLFDKRLVFPDELIHGTFENTCVKCPAPGRRIECANAPSPGLTT